MLHENHNDSFHWKNRLDELEHLPTEAAADKTRLWEQLHARLSQKPKKTKAFWYWTAAACVLMAVGISWPFTGKRTGTAASEKNLPLPQQSTGKDLIVTNKSPKVDKQHIHIIAKESEKTIVIFNDKKSAIHKVAIVAEQSEVPNLPNRSDSLQVTTMSTFQSADTVNSNLISAIPSRKRLRVIHINDLEKQSELEIRYGGAAFPSAQSKSSSYEGIPAFSLSKNSSDNIVKIKLSPSN